MNNRLRDVLIVSGIWVISVLFLQAFAFLGEKLGNPKSFLHQASCCQCRKKLEDKKPYEQLGPNYLTKVEHKKHWFYINPKHPLYGKACKDEAEYWCNLEQKILSISGGPTNYSKLLLERWHRDLLKENEQLKERIEYCKKIKNLEREIKGQFRALKAKIDQRKEEIASMEKIKAKGQAVAEECYQLNQKMSELRRAG